MEHSESPKSSHKQSQNPMKDESSRSRSSNEKNEEEERPSNNKRRFLGVRQRPSGRWVAEIKASSQKLRLWLGTFDAPQDAALAYDKAATLLRGSNAKTNFPVTAQHRESLTVLTKSVPRLYELAQRRRNYRVDVVVEDTINVCCGSSSGISERNGVSNETHKLLINRLVGSSKVYSSVVVAPSFSASY